MHIQPIHTSTELHLVALWEIYTIHVSQWHGGWIIRDNKHVWIYLESIIESRFIQGRIEQTQEA